MEAIKIILLSIGVSIAYGLLQDQITARVCVEYFTIAHPKVIESLDPTLLAIVWGVLATWWAGLAMGLFAAAACRVGAWPTLTARDLFRPVAVLFMVMAVGSFVSGVIGYQASALGAIVLTEPLATAIAAEKHAAFLADAAAHLAAYALGFAGGAAVCAWAVFRRSFVARAAADA